MNSIDRPHEALGQALLLFLRLSIALAIGEIGLRVIRILLSDSYAEVGLMRKVISLRLKA